MSNTNPYSPPQAAVADHPKSPSWLSVKIISGLAVVHLLLTYRYSSACWELVRIGALHPFAMLLGVVGAFSLYVAAVFSAFQRRGSRVFYATACICFSVSYYFLGWYFGGWSYYLRGWYYSPGLVVAFGAVLSGLGWWFVRKAAPKPLQSVADNG